MHDPDFVLFDVRRPIPQISRQRIGKSPSFGIFTRVGGWQAYFPAVLTIWHREPEGRDSGTVCKNGPGSGLSFKALRWGWKHRRHLWVQNIPWQRLNRRLWTRCAECKQPFRRNQAVISGQWGGEGPGWRKRQENVRHDWCSSLWHVRHQRDDALAVLAGTADSNARWRVEQQVAALYSDGGRDE